MMRVGGFFSHCFDNTNDGNFENVEFSLSYFQKFVITNL